jgi:hypothetical protein
MKTASIEANPPVQTRAGVYRWTICGLLFFATTINYIDRQTISVFAPDLQHALNWNELDYGNIIAAALISLATAAHQGFCEPVHFVVRSLSTTDRWVSDWNGRRSRSLRFCWLYSANH